MSQSPRSRFTTLLLSLLILCGFGGVHRIYAGKVITGRRACDLRDIFRCALSYDFSAGTTGSGPQIHHKIR